MLLMPSSLTRVGQFYLGLLVSFFSALSVVTNRFLTHPDLALFIAETQNLKVNEREYSAETCAALIPFYHCFQGAEFSDQRILNTPLRYQHAGSPIKAD